MGIPRKTDIKAAATSVEDFIKKEPLQSKQRLNQDKTGRRIISMSLMSADASWINELLGEINKKTERKVTRSEVISAAISALKQKKLEDVVRLIKER